MSAGSSENRVTLPGRIKVGWKHYQVRDWPETDARDENRLGDVNYVKELIRIADCGSDGQRAETLLHELLHAVMDMWSIDVSDLASQPNPDEAVVTALSNGLATVLSDNPKLRGYLGEVWAPVR